MTANEMAKHKFQFYETGYSAGGKCARYRVFAIAVLKYTEQPDARKSIA